MAYNYSLGGAGGIIGQDGINANISVEDTDIEKLYQKILKIAIFVFIGIAALITLSFVLRSGNNAKK